MDFEPLMSRVRAMLPSCPEPVARRLLVESAQRLCRQSLLLRHNLHDVPLQGGAVVAGPYPVNVAAMPTPVGTQVCRVLWLQLEDRRLAMATPDDVRFAGAHWFNEPPGDPRLLLGATPGEVWVWPAPYTDMWAQAMVAVEPRDDAQTLPDALAQWRDALIDGAVSHGATTPDAEYTNLPLAALHERRFAQEVSRARVDTQRGYFGSQTVRMRPFA